MALTSAGNAEERACVLAMKNIVKSFEQGDGSEITVLHGVDFTVYEGDFVSVVGQSGSGKSTLMNIIGLLDEPSSGDYYLGGDSALEMSDAELAYYRSANIGFVFQSFNLIGRISSLKNVELPMMYAGVPKKERTERAMMLLEQVGMGERMHHQPAQLSGGQKQRVAIARALANDPAIILADEPTGALDSATGRMVMDLFHQLNREQGKTIVFITHNPELAEETSRIVTMTDGYLAEGNYLGGH